ncbi:hypothetical protein PFLUV_G00138060 [Perca fluviatilis]|uniref:C1q domain-containing protein n=1 Tax=Perca fluviatilis TaxID=8168 RepID=A0A6A5EPI9_PERFL|nr:hypothetical protein PFLUV_G00138060 [Perca fluviatilis]
MFSLPGVFSFSNGSLLPNENEPYPSLGLLPDYKACGGPLLEPVRAVSLENASGKAFYSLMVKTLNKTKMNVQQVAFTAALMVAGESTIGPYPTPTTLIYEYVHTNIGNAYNPNTGAFTAPVRGAYHFELHFFAQGDGTYGSGGWLVKNSEDVLGAYEYQDAGVMSFSNGVELLLELGDVVFVRLRPNSKVGFPTTFSGHLLFPM